MSVNKEHYREHFIEDLSGAFYRRPIGSIFIEDISGVFLTTIGALRIRSSKSKILATRLKTLRFLRDTRRLEARGAEGPRDHVAWRRRPKTEDSEIFRRYSKSKDFEWKTNSEDWSWSWEPAGWRPADWRPADWKTGAGRRVSRLEDWFLKNLKTRRFEDPYWGEP